MTGANNVEQIDRSPRSVAPASDTEKAGERINWDQA